MGLAEREHGVVPEAAETAAEGGRGAQGGEASGIGGQSRQLEELNSQLDAESKAKQNAEKLMKQLEMQVSDAQVRGVI